MNPDIAFLLSVLIGLASPAVVLTCAAESYYENLRFSVFDTLAWRANRNDFVVFGGLAALYWVLSIWTLLQLFRVTA